MWVQHDAVISPCGRYRPWLMRHEDQLGSAGVCVFIMLNPSTADAAKDDPTIRRCRAFTRRLGCSTLVVANLFSARATDPGELTRFDDPVGPQCDDAISAALAAAAGDPTSNAIAAWGAAPSSALTWLHDLRRARVVRALALAAEASVTLHALGLTVDGSPRHPLYTKSDAPLTPYHARRAA